MIKLNRIGNKLGLAGAVGVLLAVGMVANQMMTEASIEQVQRTRQPIATGGRQLALRRISTCARFSSPPATSDWPGRLPRSTRPLPTCSASRPAKPKELEAALATAQGQDTRERLQKIKSLMESFTAAVEDLAKAQITLLAQIDKRSAISDEWTKALETQLTSPALEKLDNRLDIERLLFQADARVNALRAAAWRLGATGDRQPDRGDYQDRELAEGRLQQAARRGRRPRFAGRGQFAVLDRQALPGRQRGGRQDRAIEERHHRQPHGEARRGSRRTDGSDR